MSLQMDIEQVFSLAETSQNKKALVTAHGSEESIVGANSRSVGLPEIKFFIVLAHLSSTLTSGCTLGRVVEEELIAVGIIDHQ